MKDRNFKFILPLLFTLVFGGHFSYCSEINFSERNFICRNEFICRGRCGGAFSFFQGMDFDGNEKSLLYLVDEKLNCTEISLEEILCRTVPCFAYAENLSTFFGNIMFLSDGCGNISLLYMPEEGEIKAESIHVPIINIEKTFVSFMEGAGTILYIFGDGKLFKCNLGECVLSPGSVTDVFPDKSKVKNLQLDIGNNLTIGFFSEKGKIYLFTDSKDGTATRDAGIMDIESTNCFLCTMNSRQTAIIGNRILFFDESHSELILPLNDDEKIVKAYGAGTESVIFLFEIEGIEHGRRFALFNKERFLFEKENVLDGMFMYSDCKNPVFYLTDKDSTEIYLFETETQNMKKIQTLEENSLAGAFFEESGSFVFIDNKSCRLTICGIKNGSYGAEQISFDAAAQNLEIFLRLPNTENSCEKFILGNRNSVLSVLNGTLCNINIAEKRLKIHDFDLFSKTQVMNQSLYAGLVKNNKFEILFFGK